MHVALYQSSACAVLTELKNQDGIKTIADYAGLPSTSEETKVLAPLCCLKFRTSNPPTPSISGKCKLKCANEEWTFYQ